MMSRENYILTIQWKAAFVTAFIAMSIVLKAQDVPATPPVLHLKGDTRACHGRFDLTPTTLTWTSTWSRCIARKPHLLSRDANGWTFTITPTASCKFEVVRLTSISNEQKLPPGWWEASAFTKLEDYKKNPALSQLGCSLF